MTPKYNFFITPATFLQEFISCVPNFIEGAVAVYDENVSHDSGVSKLRADNELFNRFKSGNPVFLFNRSVLRPTTALGRRPSAFSSKRISDYSIYKTLVGEFDINFSFISSDISKMEFFELDYCSEEGISKARVFNFCNNKIGNWSFTIEWGMPLGDKVINSEGSFYKSVNGTAVVRGTFVIFKELATEIREIGLTIKDSDNNVILSSDTIIGEYNG